MIRCVADAWVAFTEGNPRQWSESQEDYHRRLFYAGFGAALEFFRELSESELPLADGVATLKRFEATVADITGQPV